jgi:hypothetical protein
MMVYRMFLVMHLTSWRTLEAMCILLLIICHIYELTRFGGAHRKSKLTHHRRVRPIPGYRSQSGLSH